MPTNVEFNVQPKCLRFITQVDGDLLEMRGLELLAEQASAIAWLINQSGNLQVKIEVK